MGTEKQTTVATYEELVTALNKCRQSMTELAVHAGDVAEWNEGGHAYESAALAEDVLDRASPRQHALVLDFAYAALAYIDTGKPLTIAAKMREFLESQK